MITIITSLYNANKYIDFYFKNITLCTNYIKCEHLIYNIVESNDKYVMDKLSYYSNKFKNIKIINLKKDIGLYNVWNLGIKNASYDILMTSNIDDAIHQNFLDEHYTYLLNNPNINLVCSIPLILDTQINKDNITESNIEWFNQKKLHFNIDDINYIYNNDVEKLDKYNIYTGVIKKNLYYEKYPNDIRKYPNDIRKYLNLKKKILNSSINKLNNIWVTYDYFDKYDMFGLNDNILETNNIPHACPVWRKKLNIKYGYFNEEMYQEYSDYEFWLRCMNNNEIFGLINKNLYTYYNNINSYNNRNKNIIKELLKYSIISKYIIN